MCSINEDCPHRPPLVKSHVMLNLPSLPSPTELHRMFENGEIGHDELHASINAHAKALVDEMVEEHSNPIAAYLEQVRNRRAAKKLIRKHGAAVVREVLAALAKDRSFPLAGLLWNAHHEDVPIFCFLRATHPPVLKIVEITDHPRLVLAKIAYGTDPKNLLHATITMRRDWQGALKVEQHSVD